MDNGRTGEGAPPNREKRNLDLQELLRKNLSLLEKRLAQEGKEEAIGGGRKNAIEPKELLKMMTLSIRLESEKGGGDLFIF